MCLPSAYVRFSFLFDPPSAACRFSFFAFHYLLLFFTFPLPVSCSTLSPYASRVPCLKPALRDRTEATHFSWFGSPAFVLIILNNVMRGRGREKGQMTSHDPAASAPPQGSIESSAVTAADRVAVVPGSRIDGPPVSGGASRKGEAKNSTLRDRRPGLSPTPFFPFLSFIFRPNFCSFVFFCTFSLGHPSFGRPLPCPQLSSRLGVSELGAGPPYKFNNRDSSFAHYRLTAPGRRRCGVVYNGRWNHTGQHRLSKENIRKGKKKKQRNEDKLEEEQWLFTFGEDRTISERERARKIHNRFLDQPCRGDGGQ